MASNGYLPQSSLRPIAGGGQLTDAAAAGWNAMAAYIYEETGVRIAPNGPNSSYRTYQQQVAMKAIYGSNAATPGTSNHGWGLAVDTDDYYYVNRYGARFGYQKAWSDASWEPWHIKYAAGHYNGADPGPDYSRRPPKPRWWKRVGNRIEQLRKRRLSKKQRRKQANPQRRSKLHRQIRRIGDHIERLLKRRNDA
jgi:hypothetical protein